MIENPKILVTGANGQLGSVLIRRLQDKYGLENVLATDITKDAGHKAPYEHLDVLDKEKLDSLIETNEISQIYHLAAILSANGEIDPLKTWEVNVTGLLHVLESAVEHKIDRVFFPSTIGVFGPTTPKINTPQNAPLLPSTTYGISKVTGEMWCNYYFHKYGLDVRSLRYPGIIGYESVPEGGTTDYAVEIFHGVLEEQRYTCFLEADTRLPMIYMSDAIKATIMLMEADSNDITIRSSYNLASVSFTPFELASEIKKVIGDFIIEYKPDFRQKIAESWCQSIDDSIARRDWSWAPDYNLELITKDMIHHLKKTIHV